MSHLVGELVQPGSEPMKLGSLNIDELRRSGSTLMIELLQSGSLFIGELVPPSLYRRAGVTRVSLYRRANAAFLEVACCVGRPPSMGYVVCPGTLFIGVLVESGNRLCTD